MISGFQGRSCGLDLGSLLTPAVLEKVNKARDNQKYKSSEAANKLYNSDSKKDITGDSLLRYFNTGVSKDGYWNSNYAKLQLEDAVDCLQSVYPDCDYMFLYDQSSGYTKLREDGLAISNMNLSYGGAVPDMHNTKILEVGEC